MRIANTLLLALSACAASAQNWALLNPAYKYNYSLGGTDTITNQIFVTHIDTLGVDSFRFELNKVGTTTPCDTCWDYSWFLSTERPQFLGAHVVLAPDGSWVLPTDNGARILQPSAEIGTNWLFDPINSVTATVSIITLGTVLGEPDSLKNIHLSTGDSIIVSRDHGMLLFPQEGPDDALELVGIEGMDLGTLLPKPADLFGLSPGDVIQYHLRTYHHSHSALFIYYYDTHHKYLITGREDFVDSVRLNFTGSAVMEHWQYVEGTETSYSFDAGTWMLPGDPFPFAELATAYPGRVVRSAPWEEFFWDDSIHLSMSGPIVAPLEGSAELRAEGFADETYSIAPGAYGQAPGTWGFVEYREPFGFYKYYRFVAPNGDPNDYHYEFTFEMEGAVVGGDTSGTLLPDSVFTVGIQEDTHRPSFMLTYSFPDESAHVDGPELLTELNVLDATGRLIMHTQPASRSARLDMSSFPVGAYVVNVRTPMGSASRRFMLIR
jgi:hypothetical protein